jgi:hypothetical protein
MGIFASIKDKIFGSAAAPAAPRTVAEATPATTPTASPPPAAPAGAAPAPSVAAPAPTAAAPAPAAAPMALVDVEAVLIGLAAKSGQTLNWRQSIVDLMKLLGLDSSLTARKELAKELNYTGDTNDSATMNIWLHKQVMQKLADSGGKVPESLRT